MGIFNGIPEDIEVKSYFTEELPKAFERDIGEATIEGMDGTEFKIAFAVEGDNYGVTITDAKELNVSEGGVEAPDIEITLADAAWKMALSGELENALDMFTDFNKLADRQRYDTVKDLKGTLTLVLERPEGEPFELKARFGSGETPEVTITCDLQTWQEIMSGATPAPMAFMGGKLKIAGDTPFAMSLNALM